VLPMARYATILHSVCTGSVGRILSSFIVAVEALCYKPENRRFQPQ
jgi:hypothetical protein